MLNTTSSVLPQRRDGTAQMQLVRRYARILRETGAAAKRSSTSPAEPRRPPTSSRA